MKTGIGDYDIKKYGVDEGARIMAQHGYTAIDFQLADTDSEFYTAKEEFFLTIVTRMRRQLNDRGITVSQVHGPWRFPPKDSTEDDRAERFGKMTKAMAIAKYLGAKYLVVHPLMPYGHNSPDNPEEVYEINKRYFTALSNVAKNFGIVICLENMPYRSFPLSSSADILRLVTEINHPNFKICFDTGHANLLREPLGDAVRALGSYLKVIHAHDNYGEEDSHLPPYDGTVDWADFVEGLYDIGYEGIFNLETKSISTLDADGKLSNKEIEERELELAKISRLLAGDL